MNGCICCTNRSHLIDKLKEMKTKQIDKKKVDYIIIETTGLADPASIVQTFLLNDDIIKWASIDSCITLCDASQIVKRMEEECDKGAQNEAV